MAPAAVRWFARCGDCSAVVAFDGDARFPAELACACGGRFESMGAVDGGRLFVGEVRCACDDRCTSARGPKCLCSCLGKNHGTGAVVEVRVDMGPVPIASPVDVAGAMARGAEYRAAWEAAHAARRARYPQAVDAGGAWLPESVFWGNRDAADAIRRASALKTHGGRMKTLAALTASLRAGA